MIAGESNPRGERAVVRRLTIFYGLALLLIAVIVVGFVGVGNIVVDSARNNDAVMIPLLLQEQTSSEEISLDAAASIVPGAPETNVVYRYNLSVALKQYESTFERIRNGVTVESPGQDMSEARAILATIDPLYHALLASGLHFVDLPNDPNVSPETLPASQQQFVVVILSEEEAFDTGMERITAIYQQDLALRQDQQQTLDKLLIVLTFAALALVGLGVFRPATRQVARSIQELERAEERQRELAALKDQFIIDANHELRTPIMALYNNLELLAAAGAQAAPERREQLVKRAITAGDAVLSLLSNVLDTGMMESRTPRLDLKVVPLEPLVRAVLETFDPREIGEPMMASATFKARSVTIHIPGSMEVWADEARIRQILINLISNALKYSEQGTPLEISAIVHEEAPSRQRRGQPAPAPKQFAVVQVRDWGLGVPARDATKLFNRFVRLERDIASTVRGTGVGLYVSRILVEAMGGQISVESAGVPGEGSTFTFTLPLAETVAQSRPLLPESMDLAGVAGAGESHQGNGSLDA